MPATARKFATYEDLFDLPDNVVGEIIHGQLITHPRPAPKHASAASTLGMTIGPPYHRGRDGGPGGWRILDEPELHLGPHILVPDLAGWRRERMPQLPRDHRFEVVPNWVCEILSPSTARKDRMTKMPVYARYGVAYLWLVDPLARTLEALALQDGRWTVMGLFQEQDTVSVAPFAEMALELGALWEDGGEEPATD